MSEKALTIRPTTVEIWNLIQNIAPVSATSRLFGVASTEQAAMIMLKGHELGLGLAAAFEFIHVIDGKPGVSPKGALALIHQSGELAGLTIRDVNDDKGKPVSCSVWMKRKNGFEYTASFSMDEAKQAGLIKEKSGWDKYPANMLRWRAVGYCADVVFPDVIGGMYRPEELGAQVDADGGVIEAAYTVVDQEAPTSDQKESKPVLPTTLAELLNSGYTPTAVMAANNNAIPTTPEDVQRVYAELTKTT